MTFWGAVCWLCGHVWVYKPAYRVCAECDKIERLP